MMPRKNSSTLTGLTAISILIGLGFWLLSIDANVTSAQGQVQVNAADPASAEQGTINLNVRVTGKGFKNGAKAKWFITGTTDPGGVTVNSTTFVNSTEVTANITVSDTAVIANFDIQVLNSDGRGGKGTELFAVVAKGGVKADCPPLQPAPTSDTKCYDFSPGCLDSTFGGVGYVHIYSDPVTGSVIQAQAVKIQSDGKAVVAGKLRRSSTDIDFVVSRYNADGTLDTLFGDADPLNPPFRTGYTITAITMAQDWPNSLVLQPDGKIVVIGPADSGADSVVVRYNVDGTLDAGFGSNGIVHLGSTAPRSDVALQADGKIVIGGVPGPGGFGLMRLNPDGSIDSGFGSGGLVNVNASGSKKGSSGGWALAIQRVPAVTGEERIVLVGWSKLSSSPSATYNQEWTLMRFKSNGATDTSFGSSGIVKTFFSGFGDQARRVRIDSNNRIVAAGLVRSASDNCGSYVIDAAVARYAQDGSLDGSFAGGRQIVDVYGGGDHLYGLELQADGKVLILETAYSSDGTVQHFALVRFNVDGSRDSAFGLLGNGVVTTEAFGFGTYAYALALDPTDGKIVAAGTSYSDGTSSFGSGAVARYWP